MVFTDRKGQQEEYRMDGADFGTSELICPTDIIINLLNQEDLVRYCRPLQLNHQYHLNQLNLLRLMNLGYAILN